MINKGEYKMKFYSNKIVNYTFDETVLKVTEELQKEGFGVLTEIDVKGTFKKKLQVDFRQYKILGACNPSYAYQAIQTEENMGVLLPCNFVVQETNEGTISVSAVNPYVTMKSVGNPEIEIIGAKIAEKLKRVLESL
jgi:uncharacterized protein (DUF302 family)